MSLSVLPMFSSNSFIVRSYTQVLTFRPLIHFEFIFVCGVRMYSNFIILHVAVQFSQHHFLKRLSTPLYILASFVKNKVPQVHGFISGLSILFHWSLFLFQCQYHTLLMTISLQYELKSASQLHSFSRLICLFKVFCVFHMNCKIFYSSSVKNAVSNLIGIALNLQIVFGNIVIFTILILPTQKHIISLHLFISSLISFVSVLQ